MFKKGTKIPLVGDCAKYGIEDYNVRLSTNATVIEDSPPEQDYVLVNVDEIDGDSNICVAINKSKLAFCLS